MAVILFMTRPLTGRRRTEEPIDAEKRRLQQQNQRGRDDDEDQGVL